MPALQLSPELERRLDAVAERTGRTRASLAEEAILELLDDLEDLQVAEERLAELRAGRSGTVPLDDILRRHGLEN